MAEATAGSGTEPGSGGSPGAAGGKPAAPHATNGTGADPKAGGGGEDVGERLKAIEARNEELTNANKKLMGRLDDVTKESIERRKQLETYAGVDPEAFRKWQDEQADREARENEKRGEYEKNLQKERDARAAALRERDELRKAWHEDRVKSALASAAVAAGALPHSLKPLAEGRDPQIVKLTWEEFEYDDETRRVQHRSRTNEAGSRLSPEEFFAQERASALANHFASAAKAGSGSSGGEPPASGEPVRIRITGGRLAPSEAAKAEEAQKKGLQIAFIRD